MDQNRKVIALKEPISFGSEVITELNLRKPKAKDFRRFPMEPNFGDLLDLMGRLCGQPAAVMDELGTEDLMEVSAIVGDFIPAGLKTGKNL